MRKICELKKKKFCALAINRKLQPKPHNEESVIYNNNKKSTAAWAQLSLACGCSLV